MKINTPLYIAETNETGTIICVWCAGPDSRAARPIRRAERHLQHLDTARFAGAPAPTITAWLKSRVAQSGE